MPRSLWRELARHLHISIQHVSASQQPVYNVSLNEWRFPFTAAAVPLCYTPCSRIRPLGPAARHLRTAHYAGEGTIVDLACHTTAQHFKRVDAIEHSDCVAVKRQMSKKKKTRVSKSVLPLHSTTPMHQNHPEIT